MDAQRTAEFDPGDVPGYLYAQLAEHLAGRIEAGEFAPNRPLPSERRLAEECGVSLGTVRHATRLLRVRGVVVTIRSKGTYVVPVSPRDSESGAGHNPTGEGGCGGSPAGRS